jgi:hypothetical protein
MDRTRTKAAAPLDETAPQGPGAASPGESTDPGLSRRGFLGTTGAALAVAGAVPTLARADGGAPEGLDAQQAQAAPSTPITLTVNGTEHRIEVEDRWTLNELLETTSTSPAPRSAATAASAARARCCSTGSRSTGVARSPSGPTAAPCALSKVSSATAR